MQLLWCLSAGLYLYLCWLTVGRCNAGFIKAVSAGVHFPYCSSQTTLLLLAVEECPLSFLSPFRQCREIQFSNWFFFQQWFFASGRETSSCLSSWTLWYLLNYSLCLYSHGQLVHVISTHTIGSFIMKYLIFLTQKGKINPQNQSKIVCLNMGKKPFSDITDKCGTCREQKLSVFQRSASSHIYNDHSLKYYLLSSKEMHL